jgi:hypothetical protein
VSRPPRHRAGDSGHAELARTVADADPHLRGLRALARVLDDAVRIPGTGVRVGLDPVLGLIPGVGDMIGGAVSAYAILVAARLGASKTVLVRMLGNVAVDAVVGAVPLLGDLFDLGYKANVRNVALLERHLAAPGDAERSSRAFVVLLVVAALLVVAGMVALGVLIARWVWNAVMR